MQELVSKGHRQPVSLLELGFYDLETRCILPLPSPVEFFCGVAGSLSPRVGFLSALLVYLFVILDFVILVHNP